jgi:hypothetical protein
VCREFWKDPSTDLTVELETFERNARQWKEQSGKTLHSDVKVFVLMDGMANSEARDHFVLNAARLDTHTAVRAVVLNFPVAERTWAQDMDDDPIGKGYLIGEGDDKGNKHAGARTPLPATGPRRTSPAGSRRAAARAARTSRPARRATTPRRAGTARPTAGSSRPTCRQARGRHRRQRAAPGAS